MDNHMLSLQCLKHPFVTEESRTSVVSNLGRKRSWGSMEVPVAQLINSSCDSRSDTRIQVKLNNKLFIRGDTELEQPYTLSI